MTAVLETDAPRLVVVGAGIVRKETAVPAGTTFVVLDATTVMASV